MRPSEFPPPFDVAEAIAPPTDPEDERIEVGVCIVGAGPAGLACAIRLGQLLESAPAVAGRLRGGPGGGIEKRKAPGAPPLPGAGRDPRPPQPPFQRPQRPHPVPIV